MRCVVSLTSIVATLCVTHEHPGQSPRLAGLLAGQVTDSETAAMPERFLQVFGTTGAAGLFLLRCARRTRRLMAAIQ